MDHMQDIGVSMLYEGSQYELEIALDKLRGRLFEREVSGMQVHTLTFYVRRVAEGFYDHYADYNNPEHMQAVTTFQTIMSKLQPSMTELIPAYWDTEDGKLMALVQYWVHAQNNLLTVSQASRKLYNRHDNKGISAMTRLIERGKVKTIPNPEYTVANRTRFVLADSLQRYMAELE